MSLYRQTGEKGYLSGAVFCKQAMAFPSANYYENLLNTTVLPANNTDYSKAVGAKLGDGCNRGRNYRHQRRGLFLKENKCSSQCAFHAAFDLTGRANLGPLALILAYQRRSASL